MKHQEENKELYTAPDEYYIPKEFISYYKLKDVIFDDKNDMKARKKIINYTLVRMIYEDINWKLYEERVHKIFKVLWNGFGFNKDENNDLKFMLYIFFSKYLKKIIFNNIYFELNRLVSTNLYKENAKLTYEDKVKLFKKFVDDFNLNSSFYLEEYSYEFEQQVLIVELMVGDENLTAAQKNDKFKKSKSVLGSNLTQNKIVMYREIFMKNEEYRKKNNRTNYRGSVINVARKFKIHNQIDQENLYKSFMAYMKRNLIENIEDIK